MNEDIQTYIYLREKIKALKEQQEAVAERLREAAKDGVVRCDAGTVSLTRVCSLKYRPDLAIKALARVDPIHGPKAANLAVSVSSKGVQDALAYLENRIDFNKLASLEERLAEEARTEERTSLRVVSAE